MGKGIDLAAIENRDLAAAIDDMKDQLIIVLVNRLGGGVTIPIAEIDATGDKVLTMRMAMERQETPSFYFEVKKKE